MKRITAVFILLIMTAMLMTSCNPPGNPEPDPGPEAVSWEDLYAQGVLYMIQGLPAKAEECFSEASGVEGAPDRVFAALADARMLLGDLPKAQDALFNQAVAGYRIEMVNTGVDCLFGKTESVWVTGVYYDETAYAAGQKTRYAVTVEYVCPAGKTCTIQCSVNCDHPGYFTVQEKKQVSGSGAVQFFIDTIPAKGAGEMFGFYATLYENDQTGTWLPSHESLIFFLSENQNARYGHNVTSAEAQYLVDFMNSGEVNWIVGSIIANDPLFLADFAGEYSSTDALLVLSLIGSAETLAEGDPNAPKSQAVLDEGDYANTDAYYSDMVSRGIMTESEVSKAKNSYFSQFASIEWVQYFFDRLFGKGVIDVNSDWVFDFKTSGGYVGLSPFGIEEWEGYTFIFDDYVENETGGSLTYKLLRTMSDYEGNTTYYDGSTKISSKDQVKIIRYKDLCKDERGVHISTAFGNIENCFYVTPGVGLKLRKGPSTDYDSIEVLKYRTPLVILEVDDGWGRPVNIQTGWVSMEYTDDIVAELY